MPLYEVVRNGNSTLKFAKGTFTTGSSAVSVNIGFKPKYLAVIVNKSNGSSLGVSYIYNEDVSTGTYIHAATDVYAVVRNLNTSTNYNLKSIDDNGFTVNPYPSSSWMGPATYFAIG